VELNRLWAKTPTTVLRDAAFRLSWRGYTPRSVFRSPCMAKLLYRLGMLSARRAKTVIFAWLAILGVAVGSFLTFGGQLSDQISMPDLETTEVADRMTEELDDGSGGSANVVIRTQDGESFTSQQQEA